ncbi:guanine nucleotide binding protein, alpha [Radiomyces spectabilis]|uniref:guanine nucleotide binding protein, alpha n=1 Tax=Radiomyces spectabilis TaxID=64574 RepID=UPI00221EA461|nr:guanine nucleotide binding protein, alpha [Radiomyces spectabilis]KAI8388232.1 guanine nucleotide binding protein, alpha [Radiomyces spectabilis]
MGNHKSVPVGSKSSQTSRAANSMIEKQIKNDKKRLKKEIKLLLLGAGESGKSTVLKQMRLIHAAGFKAMEREGFRNIVFMNIFSAMQTLFEVMEQLEISLTNQDLRQYVDLFQEMPIIEQGQAFPVMYLDPLRQLWADGGIQTACKRGNTFSLQDNVTYFFDRLDVVFQPNYLPTDQDIIRCRAKTTGITETTFQIGSYTYRMFDVGGQRSERKKWIHCFEGVTAVLFVVAVSGYDQCLIEDRDSNQMYEALLLFDSICNSSWFHRTSMILLLNKIDIFKRKITYSPVSHYFADFEGDDTDYNQTRTYFKNRFVGLCRNPQKRVYAHYTDATDTTLLRHVMMAVSDIIINENLAAIML